MKSLYFRLTIILIFVVFKGANAQDMSINIVNFTPKVKVGETQGTIQVDICNVDGDGVTSLVAGKAYPLITLPSALTELPNLKPNTDWEVVPGGATGVAIRLTNLTPIANGTCTRAIIGYTAKAVGGPSNVVGNLMWNGPPPNGEFPDNDNSTTSIQVLDAAAPVTLTSFTVDEFTNGNLLDWKIKDESGFSHFLVRKSLNLNEFWEIGSVDGGSTSGKYKFLDTDFQEGINYYQLKMVDLDGSYKMSPIISIENRGEFGSSTVYPNPSPNRVFKLKNSEEFDEINLMTNEGTRLPVEVRKIDGTYEVKVSESYSAGSYFLQFINSSRVIRRKVVLL